MSDHDSNGNWEPGKAQTVAQQKLRRHDKEDLTADEDLEDPAFTIQELARMAKVTPQHMRRMVSEANVGSIRRLPHRGRPEIVVRYSELQRLKSEKDEHEFLFGDD